MSWGEVPLWWDIWLKRKLFLFNLFSTLQSSDKDTVTSLFIHSFCSVHPLRQLSGWWIQYNLCFHPIPSLHMYMSWLVVHHKLRFTMTLAHLFIYLTVTSHSMLCVWSHFQTKTILSLFLTPFSPSPSYVQVHVQGEGWRELVCRGFSSEQESSPPAGSRGGCQRINGWWKTAAQQGKKCEAENNSLFSFFEGNGGFIWLELLKWRTTDWLGLKKKFCQLLILGSLRSAIRISNSPSRPVSVSSSLSCPWALPVIVKKVFLGQHPPVCVL